GVEEERLVGAAEVAGRLAVEVAGAGVADRPGENHVGRQIALGSEHPRHDAADVWLDRVRVEVMAGHHPPLAVLVRGPGLVVQAERNPRRVNSWPWQTGIL